MYHFIPNIHGGLQGSSAMFCYEFSTFIRGKFLFVEVTNMPVPVATMKLIHPITYYPIHQLSFLLYAHFPVVILVKHGYIVTDAPKP